MIYIAVLGLFLSYHAYRWLTTTPRTARPVTTWTPAPDAPKVSFLVPAWEAADDIPRFVKCYRQLSYPDKELILCAGGSDGSFEVAKRCGAEDVVVLEQRGGQGKQRALEESFAVSSGTIIYLTDIDCEPADRVVHVLLAQLIDCDAQVVTGASKPRSAQLDKPFVLTHWTVEQMTQPQTVTETRGILGRNAAMNRSVLNATQALDVPAPSGTDYTLSKEVLRAGYRILFVPESEMPTQYPETFSAYTRKQARWIRNVFILGQRYSATDEVRATLVTLCIPLGLSCLFVGWLIGCWVCGMMALLLMGHGWANRIIYLRAAGLEGGAGGAWKHFIADQVAAARAGWQVVTGKSTW